MEKEKDPVWIFSFDVMILNVFFSFAYILCYFMFLNRQTFLWFQQDSVKSIERNKEEKQIKGLFTHACVLFIMCTSWTLL